MRKILLQCLILLSIVYILIGFFEITSNLSEYNLKGDLWNIITVALSILVYLFLMKTYKRKYQ